MSQGQGQRNFRKTSGDFYEVWNPRADEANKFHFVASDDSNNVMEGYLIGKNDGVGQHNSTVWHVHEVLQNGTMGDKWSIWGDSVLNGELDKEKIGSYVRIVYKGKQGFKGKPVTQQQWTKNNSYHLWEVLVDDGAIPYNQASPGSTLKQPETNNSASNNATQQQTGGAQNASNAQPPAVFNSRNRGSGNGAASNSNASNNSSNSSFADDDLPF